MEHVRYEMNGGVARITLDRPQQLNALNAGLHAELRSCLARAENEARALLLTGAGRGFCAGQDLSERRGSPAGERPDLRRSIETIYKPLILQLRSLKLPTVCAVNGIAAGAGVSLALACDMVLAARSARFMLAFTKIGLMPDTGATFFLPRLLGHARAAGLAMTGEPLDASVAKQFGLIWDCVEDGQLVDAAGTLAERLAAGPRLAYLRIRQALDESHAHTLVQQLDLERDLLGELGRSDDYGEGVRAFLEKRPPRFNGT